MMDSQRETINSSRNEELVSASLRDDILPSEANKSRRFENLVAKHARMIREETVRRRNSLMY